MEQLERTSGSGRRSRGRTDVFGLPTAGWRINGHPARLLIWSAEEWERLDVRPIDALYHPFGVWCALRLLE